MKTNRGTGFCKISEENNRAFTSISVACLVMISFNFGNGAINIIPSVQNSLCWNNY